MRSRRRSRKKSFPWRPLGVLILVGALAIICGWMINKLLLQGYLWAPVDQEPEPVIGGQPEPDPSLPQPEEEPASPVAETAEVELRSVKFYLTQVGAVSSEAGANSLIKDLQERGNAAAYHFDGQLYRVFAGIFADPAAADGLGAVLKSMQIDAFTKEVAWSASKGQLTGEAGGYFKAAQPAITSMEEAFSLLLGAQNLDRDRIINLQSAVQAAQTTLAQIQPGTDMKGLHNELSTACNKLKSAIDAARQFVETADDHSRLISESGLIEFAELYQRFVKTIKDLLS